MLSSEWKVSEHYFSTLNSEKKSAYRASGSKARFTMAPHGEHVINDKQLEKRSGTVQFSNTTQTNEVGATIVQPYLDQEQIVQPYLDQEHHRPTLS